MCCLGLIRDRNGAAYSKQESDWQNRYLSLINNLVDASRGGAPALTETVELSSTHSATQSTQRSTSNLLMGVVGFGSLAIRTGVQILDQLDVEYGRPAN